MTLNDYDLNLADVPTILNTTPDAVVDLVERGTIAVLVHDGKQRVSLRHLRNAGLLEQLTVDDFASTRQLQPQQVESLIRLGCIGATRPFEPHDMSLRIRRDDFQRITPDAVAATDDEIESFEQEQRIEAAQARKRAQEAASRNALDVLCESLGVDVELFVAAVAEASQHTA